MLSRELPSLRHNCARILWVIHYALAIRRRVFSRETALLEPYCERGLNSQRIDRDRVRRRAHNKTELERELFLLTLIGELEVLFPLQDKLSLRYDDDGLACSTNFNSAYLSAMLYSVNSLQ